MLPILLCLTLSPAAGTVSTQSWGTFEGHPVHLYTLKAPSGMRADITDYGATVVRLYTPDRKGRFDDVVLGFDSLEGYRQKSNPYFGATIGRYANRIGNAKFTLDGKTYHTPVNNGPNTLHGGLQGFDKHLWTARPGPGASVSFTYVSADGEEGFPGRLTSTVTFNLSNSDLRIDYTATTTEPTVVALTNHSYFNLAGAGARDALDHVVQLEADRFTPVSPTLIPTGQLQKVTGTPFDFRTAKTLGRDIDLPNEQIRRAGGFDHNFVVRGRPGQLRRAATVKEPTTGRSMQVWTTEPGVQLYTGNFLDGTVIGKAGTTYSRRFAFCLETQKFPDSPNKPNFPTAVLRPGERLTSTTIYRFGH